MRTTSLRTRIEGALRTYNKFRNPEAVAELVSVQEDGKRFVVRFTGSFCITCGFYDYFEDLIYDLLDESGIKTKVLDVNEEWQSKNFLVTYQIEESESENPKEKKLFENQEEEVQTIERKDSRCEESS